MIHRHYGYLQHRSEPACPASQQLESQGYTVLRAVLNPAEVQALRTEVNRVFDEVPESERMQKPEARHMFRYAMLNHSALCQQTLAHPEILAVIEPLLGEDCHVIANTAWRNPPAKDGLHRGENWHIDAGPHIPLAPGVTWPEDIPHPVFAIGTHIYLQDCRIEDGPTGVIPGSHLSGTTPPAEQRSDDELTWQGQRVTPLLAQAGDVGLFVSDVWHRRMRTMPGDAGRFFLQVHYGRRDIAQRLQTTQEVNQLSEAAIRRADSRRERTLIGLHDPLFYDG